MKQKKHLSLLDKIFGILALISVLIFVFYYFVLPVKAAENSDNFPYFFETYKGNIPDSIINVVISDFRSASGYQGDDFIIFATDTNWTSIYFKVIINPCFNKPNNINEYSYSSSYYPIYSYNNYNQYNFWYRPDNSAHGSYGSPTANTGYNFGGDTTSTISFFYTWYPHYPVYMGSDFVFNRFDINTPSETYDNIGIYKSELPSPVVPVIPTGHATEPNINDNNNTTSDGTATQPNTPTFPIWVTPTIDTTSLETLVKSLIDAVSDFADYVGECFSTFFSWVVDSFKNGIQSIINEIRDLQTFLYNNFVSLFESISDGISYIIEPISSSVIYDNISNTSLISNIGTIESSLNSFKSSFDNLSEPNSYTIPIHFENLPVSLFGVQTTQYIDLSIINPVKTLIRTFIWALTTYGLFITIVDSISNYINGGQDE